MSFDEQQYSYRPRPVFGFPRLTPAVKALLIANVACFALQLLVRAITRTPPDEETVIERYFAFHPGDLLRGRYVWQIVTATFLHDTSRLEHIVFNMLPLTIFGFGPGLERFTGKYRFCAVYFICGIGGNLLFLAANLHGIRPVLGASGAVCGILAAYAMAFPDRLVLLFFFYPVRVKWVILGFFALEVLLEVGWRGAGDIAHGAHIGGFLFGWAYMKIVYKRSLPFAFIERMKWRLRRGLANALQLRNPFSRMPSERKYRSLDDESFLDEEIDPILEKISKYGIHSLTARERRILKRAHQRMGDG